jgi:hypothetical protein
VNGLTSFISTPNTVELRLGRYQRSRMQRTGGHAAVAVATL